jgi:hypothetical protein
LEFTAPVITSKVRITIVACISNKCGLRSAIIYDGTGIVLNIPTTPTPYQFEFKCSTCSIWGNELSTKPAEFEFVDSTGLMTLKP